MNDTPLSAQSLAESLTGDLAHVQQSGRDEEIRELEAFIASVPAQSVFTSSKKGFFYGIATMVLGALLGFGTLRSSGDVGTGIVVIVGLIFLFGAGLVMTHRSAGQSTLLTLDRRQAAAFNFPAPVPLTAVEDITVWKNYQTELHLEIADGTALPSVKPSRNPFYPPKSYVHRRRNKPDVLVVMAPGFRVNGKSVDTDDLLELLTAHVSAANAQARLDELRAHG